MKGLVIENIAFGYKKDITFIYSLKLKTRELTFIERLLHTRFSKTQ